MAAKRKDVSGRRFGALVAIEPSHKDAHGAWHWRCQCDCGNEHVTTVSVLLLGRARSCGCRRHDHMRKHGQAWSPTWRSWNAMMRRCYDGDTSNYARYGGLGIKVCERWHSFSQFLEDMGERPEGMTIDRMDPNGDYCAENCRWATYATQNRNRRFVRKYQYNGQTCTIGDLAKIAGCNRTTMYRRLIYQRMCPTEAVEMPFDEKQRANALRPKRRDEPALMETGREAEPR